MPRIQFALLGTFAVAIHLAGCGGDGSTYETGRLALAVTDAPFPATDDCLRRAEIDVSRAEAQGPGGFHQIALVGATNGVVTIDLLDLVGGLNESLAEGTLPTGEYHQIRLRIEAARLVFADDTTREFKVPSGMTSGLKVNVDPPVRIERDQTTPLVLDVDLSRSFHVTATGGEPTCADLREGPGKVMFNPVVRAANVAGTVTGIVREGGLPAGGVEVAAFPAGATVDGTTVPVATTFSAGPDVPGIDEGRYTLYLPAGTYDLYVRKQAADPRTLEAEDVVVTSLQQTVQDLDL